MTKQMSREEEDERMETIQSHLTWARAQRTLWRWREKVKVRKYENACIRRADLHYQQKVTRKVLTFWLTRLHLIRRKEELNRKCDWFVNSRLLASCYSKWRLQVRATLNQRVVSLSLSLSLVYWYEHILPNAICMQVCCV